MKICFYLLSIQKLFVIKSVLSWYKYDSYKKYKKFVKSKPHNQPKPDQTNSQAKLLTSNPLDLNRVKNPWKQPTFFPVTTNIFSSYI